MADTNTNSNMSLPQTHQLNPTLEPLLHALDPISLILNQNSNSDHPFPLRLTSADSFILERGPKYTAYAELRETRLHMKCLMQEQQQQHEAQELEPRTKPVTPPRKKQVKFQACEGHSKGSFSIAQSVPDFSSALRKENRKPVNTLPSMTPPSKSGNGVVLSLRGSKSVSGGEKKKCGGGMMARKSYACIDELKSLSSATAIAINGEGRGGGRGNKVMGKTVSGHHRQF
ncbi:hypothetical protein HKD37_13G035771 [Glycine soja]|nr:uncharacterized protein LOC114381857 [Glycine soja]KAG4958578.1 hypothetical protein JHK87_035211 [Glycine soja]